MTKTVFIFGAGASKHAGVPLMNEFLPRAQRLHAGLTPGVTKDAFDLVFKRVMPGLRGLHANSAVDLDNIETLFGLVEMGRFISKLPGTDSGDEERARAAVRELMATAIEIAASAPSRDVGV
jgi:hypothetical protein